MLGRIRGAQQSVNRDEANDRPNEPLAPGNTSFNMVKTWLDDHATFEQLRPLYDEYFAEQGKYAIINRKNSFP